MKLLIYHYILSIIIFLFFKDKEVCAYETRHFFRRPWKYSFKGEWDMMDWRRWQWLK